MRELERRVLLTVLDRKWREHLYEMDYLREGIGLRAMAQRDPLVEYQREGGDMFNAMMEAFMEEVVGFVFHLEVEVEHGPQVGWSPTGADGAPLQDRRPERNGQSNGKRPESSGKAKARPRGSSPGRIRTVRASRSTWPPIREVTDDESAAAAATAASDSDATDDDDAASRTASPPGRRSGPRG